MSENFPGNAQVYFRASLVKLALISLLFILNKCLLYSIEYIVQVVDIWCIWSQSF